MICDSPLYSGLVDLHDHILGSLMETKMRILTFLPRYKWVCSDLFALLSGLPFVFPRLGGFLRLLLILLLALSAVSSFFDSHRGFVRSLLECVNGSRDTFIVYVCRRRLGQGAGGGRSSTDRGSIALHIEFFSVEVVQMGHGIYDRMQGRRRNASCNVAS